MFQHFGGWSSWHFTLGLHNHCWKAHIYIPTSFTQQDRVVPCLSALQHVRVALRQWKIHGKTIPTHSGKENVLSSLDMNPFDSIGGENGSYPLCTYPHQRSPFKQSIQRKWEKPRNPQTHDALKASFDLQQQKRFWYTDILLLLLHFGKQHTSSVVPSSFQHWFGILISQARFLLQKKSINGNHYLLCKKL